MGRDLRKFMRERGFFESESMSLRRKDVVKTITKVPSADVQPRPPPPPAPKNSLAGLRGVDPRNSFIGADACG